MKKSVKLIILIILFVVFIGLSVYTYNYLVKKVETNPDGILLMGETETSEEEENKVEAIDFKMIDDNDNEVSLSELYGKPIVLNFWASWCPPCKAEMPEFDKVYQELGAEVEFVMLNATDGDRESKETAQKYVEDEGYKFPTYYDINQQGVYNYQVYALPTTYFIDKDGNLAGVTSGQINEEILREGIELIR